MPRPGPRPYECVRRAWHSDRHHPMRGSIIQQIFRRVNEAHSSATRKNREWQEKLPIVVLKAEEIMYSKANSEVEYMNPDTLWDRLNDAIDTIIRRDESTETGECLQPCIEAALVLGCVPVRASRSQRHSNPRIYLSPRVQEPPRIAAAAAVSDNINNERPAPQPSSPSGNQSSIPRPIMANQANSASKSDSRTNQNIATHSVPLVYPNLLHGVVTPVPVESNMAMKMGTVYPLYYGTHFRTVEPQFGLQLRQNTNPSNVIIGMPIGWSAADPAHFGNTRNLFPGESGGSAADKLRQENVLDTCEKASEINCDLSLRLGPLSESKGIVCENIDVGPSSCQEGSKCSELSSQNHEFCFFQGENANDPRESCSSKHCAESEVQDMTATLGKRKMPPLHDAVNCIHGQLDLQPNKFAGQIRWPEFRP
ncbi:hypothetical protein Ancab_035176 [Ancistrocladus abbreviatus]